MKRIMLDSLMVYFFVIFANLNMCWQMLLNKLQQKPRNNWLSIFFRKILTILIFV